ncbi:2'-5' RNA ligase family protein [Mucilaginibacter dorajii]|uniref:2'-5' RNA ligase n=1 Tax=Mucilaginibacter dorajii TaxID=692994 RepID=A0ABP7QKY4_9SPHI|nr:2'-5' RNA ligase family protein [Mucilaginibacter dorajii]MCS3735990.1 2'-5' RNA ligase [Mucilaginibacter dorajii]
MSAKYYLTVLSPPDRVDIKINAFKRACFNHIGKFQGLHARAHITLDVIRDEIDPISQKPRIIGPFYDMVDFIIRRSITTHEIRITGFNFFSHGSNFKTIYAEIELGKETTDWFNAIKALLMIKTLVPHITIARKIPVEAFDKLWPHFVKINYKDAFLADGITILENGTDNKFEAYKVYKKIPFDRKMAVA